MSSFTSGSTTIRARPGVATSTLRRTPTDASRISSACPSGSWRSTLSPLLWRNCPNHLYRWDRLSTQRYDYAGCGHDWLSPRAVRWWPVRRRREEDTKSFTRTGPPTSGGGSDSIASGGSQSVRVSITSISTEYAFDKWHFVDGNTSGDGAFYSEHGLHLLWHGEQHQPDVHRICQGLESSSGGR